MPKIFKSDDGDMVTHHSPLATLEVRLLSELEKIQLNLSVVSERSNVLTSSNGYYT